MRGVARQGQSLIQLDMPSSISSHSEVASAELVYRLATSRKAGGVFQEKT